MKTILYLATALLLTFCKSESTNDKLSDAQKESEERVSKWTPAQLKNVDKDYRGSDFQKFQVRELAKDWQFNYTYPEYEAKLKAGKVKEAIGSSIGVDVIHYSFDLDKIAGKSPKEIKKLFGEPTTKESTNPSKTPCPCPKNTYLEGIVEIVFIRGKADWITLNVSPITQINDDGYDVQRFSDYAYIKAFTK